MENKTLEEALTELNEKAEEVVKLSEEINKELKKILSFGEEHNISE